MFNYLFVFVLGCVFGSFYYVVGTRLPKGESLLHPSSHCTYCNHKLKVFELVPLLSYLFLGGKCRYCHEKLSKEYFLYELFTGILFLISYWKFHFSYEFFVMLVLSSLVVLIFITDFKYMLILDSPLVIATICIFVLKVVFFSFREAGFSLLSGVLTFIVMFSIGKIGNYLFKRESLGGGDIKFSFVIGLILGFQYSMVALILSTFLAFPYALGSMLLKRGKEVPFGPFLVGSVFIVFLFLEKFEYIFYVI